MEAFPALKAGHREKGGLTVAGGDRPVPGHRV
jgi:hypothetical protein